MLTFTFAFRCFQKFTTKFWSHSNWFKISKFYAWRWQKVEKTNKAVTYLVVKFQVFRTNYLPRLRKWSEHTDSATMHSQKLINMTNSFDVHDIPITWVITFFWFKRSWNKIGYNLKSFVSKVGRHNTHLNDTRSNATQSYGLNSYVQNEWHLYWSMR